MKKRTLTLALTLIFQSSYGSLIDTKLQSCINAHTKCFLELEALKNSFFDSFYVTKETWGNTIYYTYHCNEYTAKKIEEYRHTLNDLYGRIAINNLGDGFIIGIIAGLLTKSLNYETINSKTTIGAMLAIISLVLLQRQEIGQIPYFDYYSLEKQNNLCGIGDTIKNILLMAIGTSAGYLGTDYIITKILNTTW